MKNPLRKFDKKDPMTMATVTFLVVLGCSIAILYLAKPMLVSVVNAATGETEIAWTLVISYSLTFALLCSIGVILFISSYRQPSKMVAYDVASSFPSAVMAEAYASKKHDNR